MELRQYWQIIWRRAWIPALLVAVVGVASLLTSQPPPTSYSTSMRFTVRVKPQATVDQYNYDGYYEWLASEYMADDLTAVISSQAFATDVNRHLAEMGSGVQVPPGSIGGVTFGEKQHRVLRVNLNWGNDRELNDIAQAVLRAMEQDSVKYLNPPGAPEAIVQAIDPPTAPVANAPSLTQRLQFPVRILLALGIGLALTFVLDYLDDSVRNRAELEAMDVLVLGEVPQHKG